MAWEYHVNCGCGLGRIYKRHGMALAMCKRFADPLAFAPYFVHNGCGGELVLSVHPESTITVESGRAAGLTSEQNRKEKRKRKAVNIRRRKKSRAGRK